KHDAAQEASDPADQTADRHRPAGGEQPRLGPLADGGLRLRSTLTPAGVGRGAPLLFGVRPLLLGGVLPRGHEPTRQRRVFRAHPRLEGDRPAPAAVVGRLATAVVVLLAHVPAPIGAGSFGSAGCVARPRTRRMTRITSASKRTPIATAVMITPMTPSAVL